MATPRTVDRSQPIACGHCHEPFMARPSGPLPTYCGASCRAAQGAQRAKVDGRYAQWRATQRESYTPIVHSLTCQRCATRFTSKLPYTKWCSDVCAMRAYNARREEDGRLAKYRAERRQREREQADPSETFRHADVYTRDAWLCQLCTAPLNRDAVWPAPDSPSVDHIVPLSKGGAHTLANVQAAHLRCNLSKGDRMED